MGRSRPKIPFMMFQDVIMAVFGILILIVIYLLVNAKVSDIEFVEALEEMRQEKASLNNTVDIAEEQRKALHEEAVKAVATRETRELSKQVEANEARIEALDKEISSLLVEVEAKREDLDETISERFEKHPGVLGTRREVVEKRAEVEALEDAIAAAKSEAEKTERVIEKTESYMADIKNQFRVELDQSLAGESVYLVDFGGEQIRTFKVLDGEQTKLASPSAEALLRDIKADPGKKRVFFFVRPDAVDGFNRALVAFRESDLAVGYQPVPEGEELMLTKFPEGIPSVDGADSRNEEATSSGSAGSGEAGGSATADGGRIDQGGSAGGESGSEAQGESQGSASETASDADAATAEGGSDSGEASASPADSESEDASSEVGEAGSAEGSKQDSEDKTEEDSTDDAQIFNWKLLILLVLLLIIIFFIVKGSKR